MFSIKTKIILTYTVVFGIVLVLFAYIVYSTIERNSYEKISSNLKYYSKMVINELENDIENKGCMDLNRTRLLRAPGLYDVKIQLYDTCGKLSFADSTIFVYSDEYSKSAVPRKFHVQKIIINNQNYLSLWKSVRVKNQIYYIAQIATSLHETENHLSNILLVFIILIPLALVITAAAAYFISRASFSPIINMARTADEITINNLSTRLELPKPNDEVRGLGETLNKMISRIENSVKSQRQFIADASHEFRTPLTIIQTELELAENKLQSMKKLYPEINGNNEEENFGFLTDSLKVVLSEIEGLIKFTNDLLTIARLDSAQIKLRIQTFRIDELLLECIQNMRIPAERKNIVINLLENEPSEISADRDKIKSVILNLLDNAIKYSNPNDDVSYQKEIVVELRKNNGFADLFITDTGIGISEKDMPYIFNRFFRSNEVKSNESGNGLGLSIVKDFVEMHEGSISVESKFEKGTKFTVKLPTK